MNYIVSIENFNVIKSWSGDFKIKVLSHECASVKVWFVLVLGDDELWHNVRIFNYDLSLTLFASFASLDDAEEFACRIS